MKTGIHPDYHKITVRLTDGSEFETYSTWGKENDVMQLDIDVVTHNAWIGGKTKVNEKAGSIAKFNQKFAGINFKKTDGAEAAAAPAVEAPKAKAAK
jgi:large subunit ribosomal protein L31